MSLLDNSIPHAMQGNTFTDVMVNFIHQVGWAKGCPESWENISSGHVCEGALGKRFTFESVGWVRKIHPHQHGWETYNLLWAQTEQKGRRAVSLSFWVGPSISSFFRLGAPGSWAIGLGLNSTTGFPGSLAGREQTVRLLTFHNQFL